jgi:hypothetical protein
LAATDESASIAPIATWTGEKRAFLGALMRVGSNPARKTQLDSAGAKKKEQQFQQSLKRCEQVPLFDILALDEQV